MSRLLVVVQRYGDEVVGGSERHARVAVERLARRHDVEVATTTALDHWTWAPHYRTGDDRVGGLPVHRFPVASGRDVRFKDFERKVLFEEHTLADERDWLRRQGPHAPALLEFLHREGRRYDVILFYTYIYAPTALGLPLVPERAVLVSTAHDEAPLRLAPYRALFQLPRAIGFLTPEERDLVHRLFRNDHIPHEVLGIGLDPPPPADADAFRAGWGIAGPLVLYLGQVTEGKGCDELLAHWAAFRDRDGAPEATLVLAGTVFMAIPDRPDVRALGRVTDTDKWAALAAADALVLPSHLESLGIVLLEAWQAGAPVLVPSSNAVTAGQVRRSGGGRTYASREEFVAGLDALLREKRDAGAGAPGRGATGRGLAGRTWVERECAYEAFDARLESLVALAAAR